MPRGNSTYLITDKGKEALLSPPRYRGGGYKTNILQRLYANQKVRSEGIDELTLMEHFRTRFLKDLDSLFFDEYISKL